MPQRINTVIVGSGQAGLAISYYLKQEGRQHVPSGRFCPFPRGEEVPWVVKHVPSIRWA